MMFNRCLRIALLAAASAAEATFSGCSRQAPPPKPAPPPIVDVMTVVQRDEAIREEWIGTLDGSVNAQIRAQVTGYLLRQDYTDGSVVKKGDVLFEIDPRTFEAAVGQVQAAYEKAEADLRRASVLSEENAASRQERDNAQHAFEAAKASLAAAKLNLEFTRIVSPIDGIAGVATAQIGDLVGPNSGVLTTVSTVDPIRAYFAISEQSYLDFQRPRPGQPKFPEEFELELILADGSVYPHQGKIFSWDRQIDVNTGTLRIIGVFPNPERQLRPGQYARIRTTVRFEKGALLVPQRAVAELQGGYQVTVVDAQNVAHVRPVQLAERVGPMWIVEQGLKPDERVIVEGAQKAREGTVVSPQVVQPAKDAATPPTR